MFLNSANVGGGGSDDTNTECLQMAAKTLAEKIKLFSF